MGGAIQPPSTCGGMKIALSPNQQYFIFDQNLSINRNAVKSFYVLSCKDNPEMWCFVIQTSEHIDNRHQANVHGGLVDGSAGGGLLRSAPMEKDYIQSMVNRLHGGPSNVKQD